MRSLDILLERISPTGTLIKWEGQWWAIEDLPEKKSILLQHIVFVASMVSRTSYDEVNVLLALM